MTHDACFRRERSNEGTRFRGFDVPRFPAQKKYPTRRSSAGPFSRPPTPPAPTGQTATIHVTFVVRGSKGAAGAHRQSFDAGGSFFPLLSVTLLLEKGKGSPTRPLYIHIVTMSGSDGPATASGGDSALGDPGERHREEGGHRAYGGSAAEACARRKRNLRSCSQKGCSCFPP